MKSGIEGFERSLLPPVEIEVNADNLLSLLTTGELRLPPDDTVSWYAAEPWPIIRRRRIILSSARLTELYNRGGSLRAAAVEANVCPEIIRREMIGKGLPRKSVGRPAASTTEEVAQLAAIYDEGFFLQEVADQSGGKACDGPHLGKILRRNGFKTRPRGRPVK